MKIIKNYVLLAALGLISLNGLCEADKPAASETKPSNTILSNATADLGLSLLKEESKSAGTANSNVVVSPYGLVNVLGIMQAASAGDASAEIAHLLSPSTDSGKALGGQIKQLDEAVMSSTQGISLTSVNKVWISNTLKNHIDPVFDSIIKTNFKSDIAPLYFADTKVAVKEINTWVNAATKGQIPSLLAEKSLNKNAKAVTTNAVYFKGSWLKQFNVADTRNLPFNVKKDETIDTPTMVGITTIREASLKGIELTEIPFINDAFAFLIIYPTDPTHTLNALEEELTGRDLIDLLAASQPSEVVLQLPKFKFTADAKSIKTPLNNFGVTKVFMPNADFTPMIGKSAFVLDDVFQAAGVSIDETGAEATASSAAVQNAKAFKLDLKNKRIDRPFIFAIVHKPSSLPIFLGKLYKP
jgi:serpin B